MKALRLPVAMISALLALVPASASGQVLPGGVIAGPLFPQPGSGSLYPGGGSLFPSPMPNQGNVRGSRDGFHRGIRPGFGGSVFIYEEPEVVHDVLVVHDQPAAAPEPPPPPPAPRERYVIGRNYSSLPDGCMKILDTGATYFLCSGDWYREVGRDQYRAVEQPL